MLLFVFALHKFVLITNNIPINGSFTLAESGSETNTNPLKPNCQWVSVSVNSFIQAIYFSLSVLRLGVCLHTSRYQFLHQFLHDSDNIQKGHTGTDTNGDTDGKIQWNFELFVPLFGEHSGSAGHVDANRGSRQSV